MSRRWLSALEQHRPDLAEIAHEINACDGFKFRFSTGSVRRKEERRKRIAAKAKAAAAPEAEAGAEPEFSEHESDEEESGEWDSSTNSDDTE